MKNLLIISTLVLVFFVGCGNSSSTKESCYNTLSVNPLSLDANINVTTSSSSICTSVILTNGSASIILDGVTQSMVLNQEYKVYN